MVWIMSRSPGLNCASRRGNERRVDSIGGWALLGPGAIASLPQQLLYAKLAMVREVWWTWLVPETAEQPPADKLAGGAGEGRMREVREQSAPSS